MLYIPSFVDIHMHGSAGHDVGTCDRDGLKAICKALAAHGTGAFLPTVASGTVADMRSALGVISSVMTEQASLLEKLRESACPPGTALDEAFVLGAHLEGPFMMPEFKGALDESTFIDATVENWKELSCGFENVIKRITIDPLRPGADELIPHIASSGISVTCGHTAAGCAKILEAFSLGASSVTHIFNAMAPMHHRAPGPAGAALSHDGTYAELICDFLHVDAAVCKTVIKAKGADRVAVITDACEAAGMPDGKYSLSGREINVINGEARRPDGRLASSTVFMDKERLNLLSLGFGERDVALLTHSTPLRAINADAATVYILDRIFAVIDDGGSAKGIVFRN